MADIYLGRFRGLLLSGKAYVPGRLRTKHVHVVGPTGSGKTTLLLNMIIQDMRNGSGFGVIDPKGDLVWEILKYVPVNRFDDVVLFDPTDRARPIGFNMLEAVESDQRSLAASQVVLIFRKLFHYSWGPRLEHILRYSVLTLLEVPGATLIDVPLLLVDKDYRKEVLRFVTNPIVRAFWEGEFWEITKGRDYIRTVEPILNKVGPWLAYPEIRNIVGQARSSFDVKSIMDGRKILLVSIPEGLLGEDTSAMLGAMMVAKIQLAAMSRMGQSTKVPFYLYVDEFQNFVTSAFEKILTQARSFGLGLVVANQYEEQLYDQLRLALLNNVAVKLSCYFESGRHGLVYHELQDQAAMAREVSPLPPPTGGHPNLPSLVRLDKREIYGRPRQAVERAILGRRQAREGGGPVYYDG